jgi:signal-transduction protein with cAMP-binding, CBS, and nucleotidyltransferase domain
MDAYTPLHSKVIVGGADLARPDDTTAVRVTPISPALAVMTDLTRVDAACIGLHESMDEANQTMIKLGVRLLFVRGADGHLAGLITATDIVGEKPMRLVQERGIRHDEIAVDDLMTPMAQLEALAFDDVRHAQVGHVVASLRKAGRQHTLVVERGAGGRQVVRGIFSTSQIARQLGMPINTTYAAPTFSELVTQLA